MYLAKTQVGGKPRYTIRESYRDGECYRSRDLADLGPDPTRFIVYPGGNAFYVDEDLEDEIRQKADHYRYSEMENIFWEFVDPEIRHSVDHFRSREKSAVRKKSSQRPEIQVHAFDQRRLLFLKNGNIDPVHLDRYPPVMFRDIVERSRDEIEHFFISEERILRYFEYKMYLWVIFDLQRFFTESFARKFPMHLDPEKIDGRFVEEICRLHRDHRFWSGMPMTDRLNEYLVRYVVMFFDHEFEQSRYLDDILRKYMDDRRDYNPPARRPDISQVEAAELFAADPEQLRKMSRSELAKRYRYRAMKVHPDQGGSHDAFIRLTAAYHQMMKTKS
jgi:hypothetical protein